jgi:hypothetical protein
MIFMTEHRKMQQQLSQEQLRAITGGCGKCVADTAKAATFQAKAATLSQRSQELSRAGRSKPAKLVENAAKAASQRVQKYMGRVNARHPASSSTSGGK